MCLLEMPSGPMEDVFLENQIALVTVNGVKEVLGASKRMLCASVTVFSCTSIVLDKSVCQLPINEYSVVVCEGLMCFWLVDLFVIESPDKFLQLVSVSVEIIAVISAFMSV